MDFLNKAKDLLEESTKPQQQQQQQQPPQQQQQQYQQESNYGNQQSSGGNYGSQQNTGGNYGGQQNSSYGGQPESNYGNQQNTGGNYGGQQQNSSSGGQQILPPGNKAQGGAYTPFGGDDDDFRGAADDANRLAGSSGDKDLFSSILGSIGQNKSKVEKEEVDESFILGNFKKFVGGQDDGGAAKADDKGLGAAAAMQALKLFNQGDTKGQKETQGGFVALAMAEASKLFDDKAKNGNIQDGTTKQGVIQQAAEFALKLFMKQKVEQQGGGLAQIAGKFFS